MKFFVIFHVFINIFYLTPQIDGSKILCILPHKFRTNLNAAIVIFERLAELDHQVVVFSPYELKLDNPSIELMKVDKIANSVSMYSILNMRNMSIFERSKLEVSMANDQTDFVLSDEMIKKISEDDHYDLMILDYDRNEALLGIAHRLKIPSIVIDFTGSSNYLSLHSSSFLEFLANVKGKNLVENIFQMFKNALDVYLFNSHHIQNQNRLIKEYFGDDSPNVKELMKSVVVLSNRHFITHPPQSEIIGTYPIGGFHLQTNNDTIHPEFINTMNRAVKGIIYVSTGSTLKFSDLPESKVEMLLSVLGSLEDVLILAKYESANLKNKHQRNTIVGPWMPQQDILAHHNFKLFISIGGGTFSLIEAVHYATPLMVISIEDKRKETIDRLISRGFGKHFKFDELDEKTFKDSVTEMLENFDDYKKNVQDLSILSRKIVSLEDPLEKIIRAVNITIETRKVDISSFDFNHSRCSCVEFVILMIAASVIFLMTRYVVTSIVNEVKKFACHWKSSDSKKLKAKTIKKTKTN